MLTAGVLLITPTGRVRTAPSSPSIIVGATPITSTGRLAIANNTTEMYNQGLPFRIATGRLATADVGAGATVAYFSQGMGFTAANQVVTDEIAPVASYNGGLPFTAAGALAVLQG